MGHCQVHDAGEKNAARNEGIIEFTEAVNGGLPRSQSHIRKDPGGQGSAYIAQWILVITMINKKIRIILNENLEAEDFG